MNSLVFNAPITGPSRVMVFGIGGVLSSPGPTNHIEIIASIAEPTSATLYTGRVCSSEILAETCCDGDISAVSKPVICAQGDSNYAGLRLTKTPLICITCYTHIDAALTIAKQPKTSLVADVVSGTMFIVHKSRSAISISTDLSLDMSFKGPVARSLIEVDNRSSELRSSNPSKGSLIDAELISDLTLSTRRTSASTINAELVYGQMSLTKKSSSAIYAELSGGGIKSYKTSLIEASGYVAGGSLRARPSRVSDISASSSLTADISSTGRVRSIISGEISSGSLITKNPVGRSSLILCLPIDAELSTTRRIGQPHLNIASICTGGPRVITAITGFPSNLLQRGSPYVEIRGYLGDGSISLSNKAYSHVEAESNTIGDIISRRSPLIIAGESVNYCSVATFGSRKSCIHASTEVSASLLTKSIGKTVIDTVSLVKGDVSTFSVHSTNIEVELGRPDRFFMEAYAWEIGSRVYWISEDTSTQPLFTVPLCDCSLLSNFSIVHKLPTNITQPLLYLFKNTSTEVLRVGSEINTGEIILSRLSHSDTL